MPATTTTEDVRVLPPAPACFGAPHRALADAVGLAALAVPLRSPHPILGGVVVDSGRGGVTVHTFDGRTAVAVTITADTVGTGRSVFRHGELRQVLAGVVAGENRSVADHIPVTVSAGLLSTPDVAVPLGTYPVEEYPELPTPAAPQACVDSAVLLEQLARVLPAAAGARRQEPTLTCVRITLAGRSLGMLATDRYRMAAAEVDVTRVGGSTPRGSVAALIRADVLGKMAKQMSRYSGVVGIGTVRKRKAGVTLVTFTFGAVRISVRPDEGVLGGDEALMPSDAHLSVTVDRAAMVKAVQKAAALAKATSSARAACLLGSTSSGTISLAPYMGGEDQTRVRGIRLPVTLHVGAAEKLAAARVVFFADFLQEALNAFEGDDVTMHLPEHGPGGRVVGAVLFTDGPAVEGEGYRHLLMPAGH